MSDSTHVSDSYNPAEIERKWQARWEEQGTNAWTDEALRSAERPFYNLMMFPYPSAEEIGRAHV
jgi:leucyl-tRNA synthetase